MMTITAAERRAIATQVGVDEQYLYQCLTRRKAMRADEAVRVEQALGGRIRRWDLRADDWHRIWPELIGSAGAPDVPQEVA